MAKLILKSVLLLIVTLSLVSFDLPSGWFSAGSKPDSYKMGIDKGAGQDGKNAATIKSEKKRIKGFGTLMQDCKPNKFLGKRVRMSCYIKSENVKSWAGLWLRVDQPGSYASLAFDNMSKRPIKGTTGWTKYEIVLNIGTNASNLAYGVLLDGTGQVWFDNITFEIVDDSVQTTDMVNGKDSSIPAEPINLDFEN